MAKSKTLVEGTNEECCGACKWFKYEDIDGYGVCTNKAPNMYGETYCGDLCKGYFEPNVKK